LESLPPSERAKKLEQYRLVDVVDIEQELDDETEEQQDTLLDATLVAETLERLREEVDELARLVRIARDTLATGKEAKLEALENLPPSERAKKLEQYRLVDVVDIEQELDDETEEQQDTLLDATLVAETLERLREEVDELARLVRIARDTLATGKEAKLEALEN